MDHPEGASETGDVRIGFDRRGRLEGSVAKFRISVALPGVSSQTPHFPETKSGLNS